MPSRWATPAAMFGIGASAVQVATITRSMSSLASTLAARASAPHPLAPRRDRHVRDRLVRPGDPPAGDAHPAADPLVVGVDRLGQVVVGDHLGRLVAAERQDPRPAGTLREPHLDRLLL